MDWGVQQIVTAEGDVFVVMPLAQFLRLSAAAEPLSERGGDATPPEVREAIADGGSPLAAWRKYRDMSQSRLARAAGVSRFTVMRMEAGGAGAGNRHSRQLLASALGIPIGAL